MKVLKERDRDIEEIDVKRTLAIYEMLAADDEDLVVKALSWALRELVVHDPGPVPFPFGVSDGQAEHHDRGSLPFLLIQPPFGDGGHHA